jgi:hypothetical protein
MRKLKKITLIDEMENSFPKLSLNEQEQVIGGDITAFEIFCALHYVEGTGSTMNLPDSLFNLIAQAASDSGVVTGSSWVVIDGKMYQQRTVNLYGCDEVDLALGTCTIYYDQNGKAVGLKDTYDFNFGGAERTILAHIGTGLASLLLPGSKYDIYYGIHN